MKETPQLGVLRQCDIPKLGRAAPELVFRAGGHSELGQLVRHYGDRALVVSDQYLTESTAHTSKTVQVLHNSGVEADVHAVSGTQLGTLDSAIEVHDMLVARDKPVCVALGGGSILDAAKLACAAFQEPWLLDVAVWTGPTGQLPTPGESARRELPPLVAVPTRPGTAAQVSPRVSLAPGATEPRRLVDGSALLPTAAVVDPQLSATLGRLLLSESVSEVMLRALGPYLVTKRSSTEQDHVARKLIGQVVELGEALIERNGLTEGERTHLDYVSMATAYGWHTEGWCPAKHPWWCIQNSVVTHTGRSKGSLTAQAIPALLNRVTAGDEVFGSQHRWQELQIGTDDGDQGQRLTQALAMPAQPATGQTAPHTNDHLKQWAKEVTTLWAGLPSISELGAEGVYEFLCDSGM